MLRRQKNSDQIGARAYPIDGSYENNGFSEKNEKYHVLLEVCSRVTILACRGCFFLDEAVKPLPSCRLCQNAKERGLGVATLRSTRRP